MDSRENSLAYYLVIIGIGVITLLALFYVLYKFFKKDSTCKTSLDCKLNETCIDGKCQPTPTPQCKTNNDCKANETCVNGVCKQTITPLCNKIVDKNGQIVQKADKNGQCLVQLSLRFDPLPQSDTGGNYLLSSCAYNCDKQYNKGDCDFNKQVINSCPANEIAHDISTFTQFVGYTDVFSYVHQIPGSVPVFVWISDPAKDGSGWRSVVCAPTMLNDGQNWSKLYSDPIFYILSSQTDPSMIPYYIIPSSTNPHPHGLNAYVYSSTPSANSYLMGYLSK